MPKYIAFLRAINVGGHTVKMDHLRGLFEALGLSNVETFIASGNVIFDSASKSAKALAGKIEKHLRESLGYEVATFIRSPAELAAVAHHRPFKAADLKAEFHALYIGFLADEPGEAAIKKLQSFATAYDSFHVHGREVYWLCRKKFAEAEFSGAQLEKTLGMPATLRNVTTVKKLVAKYS